MGENAREERGVSENLRRVVNVWDIPVLPEKLKHKANLFGYQEYRQEISKTCTEVWRIVVVHNNRGYRLYRRLAKTEYAYGG